MDKEVARTKLLAAALQYAASEMDRFAAEFDAQLELSQETLDQAVSDYVFARRLRHPPYVPGAPVDPELERLLAEEEEIERATREQEED